MASYQFTVTGIDLPMTSSEQMPDHETARREAILFLSELLRDLAVTKRDGSEIEVQVQGPEGEFVYSARARLGIDRP